MTEVIAIALALMLGLLVGLRIGAWRAFRLVAQRRAMLGAAASLARFLPSEMPTRSAADILAGVIRVVLGGVMYELPVLPRAASRAWLDSLDARFAALASELERAGDDTPQIMALLVAEADGLIDVLRSYDQGGILPAREHIDEYASNAEILRAVIEVWRATHPLAATLASIPATSGTSPEPPSSSPLPTAGPQPTSSGA